MVPSHCRQILSTKKICPPCRQWQQCPVEWLTQNYGGPLGSFSPGPMGVELVYVQTFTVKAQPFLQFDPTHCAKQHLRVDVDDLVTIASPKHVASTRMYFKQCSIIDKRNFFRAF